MTNPKHTDTSRSDDLVERFNRFLNEWGKSRQYGDVIYGLHVGTDREVELTATSIRQAADRIEALCRAIEQHEAFRQEVSDAVEGLKKVWGRGWRQCSEATMCDRFIIAKPDPLVEAWKAEYPDDPGPETSCNVFRAAIKKRGGKIVWGEG